MQPHMQGHRGGTNIIPATQRKIPGPRGHFFLGILPEFRRDPLRLLTEASAQYGDVVHLRAGVWSWYLVTHPDHVKYVLQENSQNYEKGRIANLFKIVIGDSLLASEGEFWRRQRRLAQPAFHRKRVAGLLSGMIDATAAMLDQWRNVVTDGQPLDVVAEMMRLTLRIVGNALFSTDLSNEAEEIGGAASILIEHSTYRFTHLLALPEAVPTPRNRRFRRARQTLDAVVQSLITTRRRKEEEAGDLLAMLMSARDEETSEGMSDQQLRDEVRAFILAGHETTASALAWTWLLLSQHPEVEQQLRAELKTVLGRRTPTFEDIPHLSYTKMVLEESMRLYPPGWGFERRAIAEDDIGDYHLPAKSLIFLSPYATHRHPEFWEQPERFDPERFSAKAVAQRPRYAYFPFGGGPRICIGNDFAMIEAQLILAMVAQQYHLQLIPSHPIEPEPTVTLRPRHGMLMTVHTV